MRRVISLGLFVISLSATTAVQAKSFSSKYCEFELPIGWECQLEGSEYVCQSTNAKRQKEAIIILAAKMRGPQDALASYQGYLKKTKTFNLPGGKTQVSDPKYTKQKSIMQRWPESIGKGAEFAMPTSK